jgi:hypothetical protein
MFEWILNKRLVLWKSSHSHILAYVDDILAISHDPEKILLSLADFYCLNNDYSAPTHYIRAQVKQ